MHIPFISKKDKISHINTQNTLSNETLRQDSNNDKIPDFLQREHYASITNSQKDFIRWESDPKEEIEEYIYGLKGYDFDVKENVWKPVSPPIINDYGINFVKHHLRAVINKHSMNTSLSEEDAHKIALSHSLSFSRNLKYRKKIYGIHLADLDPIVDGFDNFITIILCKSIGDAQRDHNDKRLSMNYSGTVQPKTV